MIKQDSFLLDVTVKDIWFVRLVNTVKKAGPCLYNLRIYVHESHVRSEGLIQTTAKGVKIHRAQRNLCVCAYWSGLIRDTILRGGKEEWGGDHCTGNRKQQSEKSRLTKPSKQQEWKFSLG